MILNSSFALLDFIVKELKLWLKRFTFRYPLLFNWHSDVLSTSAFVFTLLLFTSILLLFTLVPLLCNLKQEMKNLTRIVLFNCCTYLSIANFWEDTGQTIAFSSPISLQLCPCTAARWPCVGAQCLCVVALHLSTAAVCNDRHSLRLPGSCPAINGVLALSPLGHFWFWCTDNSPGWCTNHHPGVHCPPSLWCNARQLAGVLPASTNVFSPLGYLLLYLIVTWLPLYALLA